MLHYVTVSGSVTLPFWGGELLLVGSWPRNMKDIYSYPLSMNPKILSLNYCCFKIRARERRGMTKVEVRKGGTWVMKVRPVNVIRHKLPFRWNTCHILQFCIVNVFLWNYTTHFCLYFCIKAGKWGELSVFLSLSLLIVLMTKSILQKTVPLFNAEDLMTLHFIF